MEFQREKKETHEVDTRYQTNEKKSYQFDQEKNTSLRVKVNSKTIPGFCFRKLTQLILKQNLNLSRLGQNLKDLAYISNKRVYNLIF